jgi:hypothetical protein
VEERRGGLRWRRLSRPRAGVGQSGTSLAPPALMSGEPDF